MKTILWLLIFFLFPVISFSQKLKPEKLGRLPANIRESSGLAIADSNSLWTMNDSGDKNYLYRIGKDGKLIQTLLVRDAVNHDWEDLADNKGEAIFIGDFGNNLNKRKNLAIYKIQPATLQKDTAIASILLFHYPDQKQFPPPPSNWNFDCEAFFYRSDSLFLFSKNTSNPNDGFAKMYRLKDEPGDHIAELADSFQLNEPVTAADISPDGKTVVLLTYFSLWVLKDFPDNHFFRGKIYRFPFKKLTQKEGIAFASNDLLYLTDEKRSVGGNLYQIDLSKLDYSHPGQQAKVSFFKKTIYNLYNNPKAKYKKIKARQEKKAALLQ